MRLLLGDDAKRRTVLESLDRGFVSVSQLPMDLTGDCVSGCFGKLALDLGAYAEIFELIDWRHGCNSHTGGTDEPRRSNILFRHPTVLNLAQFSGRSPRANLLTLFTL